MRFETTTPRSRVSSGARIVPILLGVLLLAACGSGAGAPADPVWRLEVSDRYRARQADYLEYCNAHNGPGEGGIHGQVCRVAAGETTYNREAIDRTLAKIDNREDTSDFDLNSVLRMLYLDRETGALPDDLRTRMQQTVLDFKYWLDEPGPDHMVWWSENHQILFHTAELLAGRLYPDETFSNSGMTGREHIDHALPRLRRWLRYRAWFGFSEFHSNVYYNEDMPPLLNLVDFAEDERIRAEAAIILDLLLFDMASHYHKGVFATAHGRTYPSRLIGGLRDSTTEAAYIGLDLVPFEDISELGAGNFTAAHMATSRHYAPPILLEEVATDAADGIEHRQRDGIDIADGPAYGIGYTDWADIMFWWGMTGYVAPRVITGTFEMVDNFSMWDGWTWSDLQFLRPLVGTSVLREAAETAEPMSRGVALEAVDVYTYRTPNYQLSGAQDFKPSDWTAQVHIWTATIDKDAYVFTTWPGGTEGDYMATDWTGGFVPRATMHKSVGIFQYRRPAMPELDGLFEAVADAGLGFELVDYTHAYFPRNAFDAVTQAGHWTFGAKDGAYVALWSEHPVTSATDNDHELIARAPRNTWIVELGDHETYSDFEAFWTSIAAAEVSAGERVVYDSPAAGRHEVGWTGPLTVDGEAVDLGPYDRWDNPYARQAFGTRRAEVRHGGRLLELDFDAGRRAVSGR